jgi:hypothetical protein
MHGLSLRNQDSWTSSASLPVFHFPAEPGSNAPQPVCKLFLTGADIPKRPFTRPQREPASEPHCEVSVPGLLPSYPPDLHRIRSSPVFRNAPPASTPLWGFLCPSGSQCSASLAFQKLTSASRPISLRSPWPDSINDDGLGSMFQVRYVPRGSLFPCTSWNQDHDAPDRYSSQTNS